MSVSRENKLVSVPNNIHKLVFKSTNKLVLNKNVALFPRWQIVLAEVSFLYFYELPAFMP